MRKHLTDAVVRRLPPPDRGNRITKDIGAVGFGARVTAAGFRSFTLDYTTTAGRERRYTIGDFPNWSTTAARQEARRLRQLIDQGIDPLADAENARAAPTVADMCDRFEQEHLPRKRTSTARDYARMLKRIREHFGPHIKVADVVHADCDALHRRISKTSPYSANRYAAVLSKLFALAVRWGWRLDNPAKGIERNVEHHRRRYLAGDELERLTAALAEHPDQQTADVVRVLLLTGSRSGEAMGMRWADLDLVEGVWSKLPSSTKQKSHHQVSLSAPVRQLLAGIWNEQKPRSEFVFPGTGSTGHVTDIKKGWAVLCEAAAIDGLRVHDLRHSFASQLASGGASLPLIGALLGHASATTTARYSHLFRDPQRAAVEKVGAIIAGIPAVEPVVLPPPSRRRRRRD
jgi:integrase